MGFEQLFRKFLHNLSKKLVKKWKQFFKILIIVLYQNKCHNHYGNKKGTKCLKTNLSKGFLNRFKLN